jgi:hypothetical protein
MLSDSDFKLQVQAHWFNDNRTLSALVNFVVHRSESLV